MLTQFRDEDLIEFETRGALPLPAAPQQGRLEQETASIWHASYGSGPPVILLHGSFDNSEEWGYQVDALVGSGYRAVLIDSRGRGRSTLGTRPLTHALLAGEVLAVMDALHLDRASIIGWSDGAVIALTLAMSSASRVARVFAFGAAMDPSGWKEVDTGNPLLGRVFGRAKRDYARLSPNPKAFGDMAKEVNRMNSTEPNASAGDLAGIKAPVAIVLGEFDEFVKPEHADYLARTIPGAQRITLPGVSHFALLQRPDEFNQALLAFLGGP